MVLSNVCNGRPLEKVTRMKIALKTRLEGGKNARYLAIK